MTTTKTEELDRILRAVITYRDEITDDAETCAPLQAFRDAIDAAADALDTMAHHAADSNDMELRDRLDAIVYRFVGLRSELS